MKFYFRCTLVSLIVGSLPVFQSFGDDDEKKNRDKKLVMEVVNTKFDMVIFGGGSFLTRVDWLTADPNRFHSTIRNASLQLEQGKGYTNHMKKLVARPDLVDEANKQLKAADPLSIGADHLAIVLGKIGNRESVPILIDFYKRALEKSPDPGGDSGMLAVGQTKVARNCSWALWKLTGRHFATQPDRWQKWWTSVEPYFEVASKASPKRKLHSDYPKIFDRLKTEPMIAREQLIAIGPTVVKPLMEQIEKVDKETRYQICWVVDELGQSRKLKSKLQRQYYFERCKRAFGNPASIIGIEEIRKRLFSTSDLIDFCKLVIEIDRYNEGREPGPQMWSYIKLNSNDFRAKYGTKPTWIRNKQWEDLLLHTDISPLGNKESKKQIEEAVPVLVSALKDESVAVRRCSAQIANMIGFATDAKPEKLIIALRDAWIGENDDFNLGEAGYALARFDSPIANNAFKKGLFSKDERIVRTSANTISKRKFPVASNPLLYDRLAELTAHTNSRIRFASIRSLSSADPKRLILHLDRLKDDVDPDVREQVCYAIRNLKNPMFQDILVQLATKKIESREDENVRQTALGSLADPVFKTAMDDIKPLLNDPKIYGYALNTIVNSLEKDSLPFLLKLLDEGEIDAKSITQYLPRLTGKNFKTPDEWIDWWKKQKSNQ